MKISDSNHFFENIYKDSQGNEDKVPWAEMQTDKYLEEYLEMNLGEGKAIVIGCGLGDDAAALEDAGFNVTAIDISQTAIDWAKERYDHTDINFFVQDIFELPTDMLAQYDFIFESRTIQSLPLEFRNRIIEAISSLMAPKAKALVIANGKEEGEKFDGPPWPLEYNELRLYENHASNELEFSIFESSNKTSKLMFRALYQK
jgi:ubiquinone/menaquinone biosynthesis C-methylase UbiE